MGLFGKHKEEKKNSPPPMSMAPPMPSVAATKTEVEPVKKLETPPIPGNGLKDIKTEVMSSPSPIGQTVAPVEKEETPQQTTEDNLDFGNDSLFDFSSLDVENEIGSQDTEGEENDSHSSLVSTSGKTPEVTDVHQEHMEGLNFIKNGRQVKKAEETFYITTSQFKSMLEIIQQVKDRVKFSTETHLRLLDLKSEEDIEFENLRKDFEFMEDKLYELDKLIFEK